MASGRPPLGLDLKLTDANGTTVREYVSPQGSVFGITWQGRSTPDMNQLLGTYVTNLQTATPAQKGPADRPTSTPYSGDLSIFEYPDRDKKLQIDRVMDLLGISAGENVADIGAGSGWFTVKS